MLSLYFVEDSEGTSHGELARVDERGLGGDENLSLDGGFMSMSGWYELVVAAVSGSSCAADYTLIIYGGER